MSRNSHNISEIGPNYFHVTSDATSELSSKKVSNKSVDRAPEAHN